MPKMLIFIFITHSLSAAEFGGSRASFHGFIMHEFMLEGVSCKVVEPKEAALGKPWIWRARFWGHQPQLDKELLNLGWHVVYCDVANLFGNSEAVRRWDVFYEFVTNKYGFNKRPVLEGMSRGGLIVYNWAKANPNKVSCIYGDAPVCDIKSWPGGKGKGKGGGKVWQKCLRAYGLTDEAAHKFKGNPIDGLAPLAKAGVRLIHVVGDVDTVVPVAENTRIVEERYKKLGGTIKVIHKPEVGHHPHSLKNPKPLLDFILKAYQVYKK